MFSSPRTGYRSIIVAFADSLRKGDSIADDLLRRFERLLSSLDAVTATIAFWDEELGRSEHFSYACREAHVSRVHGKPKRWSRTTTIFEDDSGERAELIYYEEP